MTFSRVKTELQQRLQTAVRQNGNAITNKITFDEDFCGFAGHFPDNPIVPAVCLLATAELLAMELTGCQLQLQEITTMKFKKHLMPNDTACFKCVLREQKGNQSHFNVTIMTELDEMVANIRLIMTANKKTTVADNN